MKTKNIVITGTSRGIGFQLVKLFANQANSPDTSSEVLTLTKLVIDLKKDKNQII